MTLDEIHSINEKRLAEVHSVLRERVVKLLGLAAATNTILEVTQGLRTFAEQDLLFKKHPPVTHARGGQSMHNYGLAVDVAFIVNGEISWNDKLYHSLASLAVASNLEWGGNWHTFKDLPHLQLPHLPGYKFILPVYQKGGIDAVWKQFNG